MGMLDDIKNKASELLGDNADKVEELNDQAVEKASSAADGATGGKFTDQIDAGAQKADDLIGE